MLDERRSQLVRGFGSETISSTDQWCGLINLSPEWTHTAIFTSPEGDISHNPITSPGVLYHITDNCTRIHHKESPQTWGKGLQRSAQEPSNSFISVRATPFSVVARFPTRPHSVACTLAEVLCAIWPVFTLSGDTELFDLTLHRVESLSGRGEEDQLRFDELVEVLDRLRLRPERPVSRPLRIRRDSTHVLEDGLHQGDRDLRLLDEVILSVLNLKARVLLLRRARVLEPADNSDPTSYQIRNRMLTSAWQHPAPTD